jgi:Zn-dependent protease
VLNLLPVLPLDGGQISAVWLSPRQRVLQLSRATGAAMALFGAFVMGSPYVAVLFGWLAWQSHTELQHERRF